jgi:hypothetical protein
MYASDYDDEYREETNFFKKNLIWFVGFILVIGGLTWFFGRAEREVDKGIANYEAFEEMYSTCQKINADLASVRQIPGDDPMFSQFSKQAQIAQKRQQLTRWIEEYNAKSRMVNRALWKSDALPYQLTTDQFTAYTN